MDPLWTQMFIMTIHVCKLAGGTCVPEKPWEVVFHDFAACTVIADDYVEMHAENPVFKLISAPACEPRAVLVPVAASKAEVESLFNDYDYWKSPVFDMLIDSRR